jgi:hypothetical protein
MTHPGIATEAEATVILTPQDCALAIVLGRFKRHLAWKGR